VKGWFEDRNARALCSATLFGTINLGMTAPILPVSRNYLERLIRLGEADAEARLPELRELLEDWEELRQDVEAVDVVDDAHAQGVGLDVHAEEAGEVGMPESLAEEIHPGW
jgi:hypothetical protein